MRTFIALLLFTVAAHAQAGNVTIGNPVNAGDIATKAYVDASVGGGGRTKLSAPLTLLFGSGQAFGTLQTCINAAQENYDTAGFQIVCKSAAAGNYQFNGNTVNYGNPRAIVGASLLGQTQPCGFLIDGNGAAFADNGGGNIIQTGNGGWGGSGIPLDVNNSPRFCIQNMMLSSPAGAGMGLQLTGGQVQILGNINFGCFGGMAILAEGAGTYVTAMYGGFNVWCGGQWFASAQVDAQVTIQGENISLLACTPNSTGCSSDGWPNFTNGFLDAEFNGKVFYGFPTVNGQARGKQYTILDGGMIKLTQSPSAPIPGNLPGSCTDWGYFNSVKCP